VPYISHPTSQLERRIANLKLKMSNEEEKKPKDDRELFPMLPKGWNWASFMDGMDNQRLARLRNCEKLRAILTDCQAQKKDRTQLEDIPMGIRSVRYYQWRDQQMEDSCAREEHALWACRATAVRCGGELVQLRDCFTALSAEQVLDHPETAYELNSKNEGLNIPCKALQRTMGDCIKKHTLELDERLKNRTP